MKKLIAFLAVIILIAATTSAFAVVSGYVASGGGGVVNIFQANGGNLLTTVSTGAGVDGVSFASNGDLYCIGHWSNNVYKAAYLGNGTWAAAASLYASIPSTYGTQNYNYAYNLAAKNDGTVFVGSYDTAIYKIAPDKTVTQIVVGNGWTWMDMDITPAGVIGDFVAINQYNFLKSYNADGSDAGFDINQWQNRCRFTAFANGKLYASASDNWDTINEYDPNDDTIPGTPYITLTLSPPENGTNYFMTGAYGPDANGDGYGDFFIKHNNDILSEIQVYSGAPGLATDARYLTAFGNGTVGSLATDAFTPVPEPSSILALLSFIAPAAMIYRKRRA